MDIFAFYSNRLKSDLELYCRFTLDLDCYTVDTTVRARLQFAFSPLQCAVEKLGLSLSFACVCNCGLQRTKTVMV